MGFSVALPPSPPRGNFRCDRIVVFGREPHQRRKIERMRSERERDMMVNVLFFLLIYDSLGI